MIWIVYSDSFCLQVPPVRLHKTSQNDQLLQSTKNVQLLLAMKKVWAAGKKNVFHVCKFELNVSSLLLAYHSCTSATL